ncbi:ParB N-terminal domain-containing protein [Aurantimonas sp. 22II-16-19i]|uniref:ParB N-terminal domain-containing protein n=1 Tax=Aurantimonas sp. 22II-16-19i TaxID=1317114 RepID=UPI0009F7C669|nr:ParB N-terminal domain-containing protein [Aurantimonas sp. 22II-16-19i]ORE98673.1 ParB domain-containing protein nuclease [Aurantimonas sp. 22II-16-19i]
MTTHSMISLASIETEGRLRALDPVWVSVLAEEFARDGQTDAIRVVARGNGFKLVKGARRIAAALQLGWSEIEARIEPEEALPDDAAVRLAEIKSNMLRSDLTALDRAVYVAAWCEIYQGAQPAQKPGRKKAAEAAPESDEELSTKLVLNWTEAAQQALKIGRMGIFRSLKIAKIEGDLRSRIALHAIADVQRELLLLAELTPVRQRAVVDLLTSDPAKATSVTEALALLDHAPGAKPVPVYERMYERFVRLKAPEKEAFFEMNAEAIDVWLAKRATKRGRAA